MTYLLASLFNLKTFGAPRTPRETSKAALVASFVCLAFLGCENALNEAAAPDEQGRVATTQQSLATGQSVTVTAVPLWTDTGIVLAENDTVTISDASGSWTWGASYFGPDGDPQPDLIWDEWIRNGLHGQLIGAVLPTDLDPNAVPRVVPQDDPKLFSIGTRTVTRTGTTGRLWLGFNDDYVSLYTSDNAGFVVATVKVDPPVPSDQTAAASAPPKLCDKVCERVGHPGGLTDAQLENLRAVCYSCRCAQVAGHAMLMDKASETPSPRTFVLGGTPLAEQLLGEENPLKCVNPALLEDVPNAKACATGNHLGQASWTVNDRGTQRTVYSKWIFRKKGAGAGKYNDWGKIYHRDDGFTCNFDDIDSERAGDSIGQPEPGSYRTHDFPALDLTWVVKFWEDRQGLDDEARVLAIANDDDVTGWRGVFHVITGEQPGSCAMCHSAGPYLFTPFLGNIQYKGTKVAWSEVAIRNLNKYVYPGFNGSRRQVRTGDAADEKAKTLSGDPIKEGVFNNFKDLFRTRSREFTGAERPLSATAENQATLKKCFDCHRIGQGFYLNGLSINSTGTVRAPIDRPYQPEFITLLGEPVQAAGYHWAMWMPNFGDQPATLADWLTKFVESKVMLEFCTTSARCNFTEWGTTGNNLPQHF
jgi:hypothetical protein